MSFDFSSRKLRILKADYSKASLTHTASNHRYIGCLFSTLFILAKKTKHHSSILFVQRRITSLSVSNEERLSKSWNHHVKNIMYRIDVTQSHSRTTLIWVSIPLYISNIIIRRHLVTVLLKHQWIYAVFPNDKKSEYSYGISTPVIHLGWNGPTLV